MADYRTQKVGPGIVIFVAVFALIFLTIKVGDWTSAFAEKRELTLLFDSVSGIKKGTQVTFAGKKIGEVKEVEFLSKPTATKPNSDEGAAAADISCFVRVTASVSANAPINSDTRACIMMAGMLGDKLVALTPGNPEAAPLSANAFLAGENTGIERLMVTGKRLIKRLEGMMNGLDGLLVSVNGVMKDPQFTDNLKGTIAHAKGALEKAQPLLVEAKELLDENRPNIKGMIANARDLTAKGCNTLGTLNDTLGDVRPKLNGTLNNVQQLTSDMRPKVNTLLEKTTTTVGKAGDTLDTTKGLLSDNRENITTLLSNLRATGGNAKHFTHTLRMVFAPWSAFNKDASATNQPTGVVKVPASNVVDSANGPLQPKKDVPASAGK